MYNRQLFKGLVVFGLCFIVVVMPAFSETTTKEDNGVTRMLPSWVPEHAFAIGGGILFSDLFVYPDNYMDSPYFMTTTPIAFCNNDDMLVPVLTETPRGISIAAFDNSTAYVIGGIFYEEYDEYNGYIHPSRLFTSTDGVNWNTLPDAPEIMWKMPYHLFKANGCLYLECSSRDLKEYFEQYLITLEPGLLINSAYLFTAAQDCGVATYRSCDDGATWTEVSDIPWHDIFSSSIPQNHCVVNGTHYARSVTDINNQMASRAYLYYSDNGIDWQLKNVIPEAVNQHVSSIAATQDALYCHAADMEYMSYYYYDTAYDGPTVWKSTNGLDWVAQSMQLPLLAGMASSDNALVAAPLHYEGPFLATSEICYSDDGAEWFAWRDWPVDCDNNGCYVEPLIVTSDAAYIKVNVTDNWPEEELWRMPLTLFSPDTHLRVTINRALGQPINATSFPVVFDIVWNKPVIGFESSDIVLDGYYFLLTESQQKGDGTHFTLTVTGIEPSWTGNTIAPQIPAGVALDDLSNPNEAAFVANASVTLNLPPEMPISGLWTIISLLVGVIILGSVRLYWLRPVDRKHAIQHNGLG